MSGPASTWAATASGNCCSLPIHNKSDRRIVAVSDLNRDGNLDIHERDTVTGQTFVWLGDGWGGFRPK